MTAEELSDLQNSLEKFNHSLENAKQTEIFQGFQDLLIELVEKIIGSSTHADYGSYTSSSQVAQNMTLNEAWLQIFGVEYSDKRLKEIREIKLGDIAAVKGSRKNLLKRAIDKFMDGSEVFINEDYMYNCESCCELRYWEHHSKRIFWVPLEDIPGTSRN